MKSYGEVFRPSVLSAEKRLLSHADYITVLGLITITLITGLSLSAIKVSADSESAVTTASVTVAASCSMTSTIDTPHTAEISNGTYQANIGQTTIKTFCNDNSGYAIYTIGFTGDSYDSEDHTKLIGATNGQKIVTGTDTSGNTSKWAMKLIKVTNSEQSYNPESLTITNDYDDYNVIPDTYTKVANYTSTTDLTLGSVLTTTYAAYISPIEVADTYVGKVKYTLVHPNTEVPAQPQTTEAGKICYYANASDAVGTMGCQTIPASNEIDGVLPTSAILLASNFSRTGYGFAGWSNKFDYATNTDDDLKFYGPQEYITFEEGAYSGGNNGLSLYAVWVKSEGSIQDTSKVTQLCGIGGNGGTLTITPTDGTASLSSVSALTDQRDNQTYAIARLADGKCWMIENLRLESTAVHNSDGTLAQGYGTSVAYGNFLGLATAESANFRNSTTANSLYYSSTQDGTATIDIGTTNNPGYRFPRYNNVNTSSRASNPTTNSHVNMYSYGNYYTWHAAIADLTYNGTNNNSVTSTSLCPTGWRLPQGGDKTRIESNNDNDFWNLTVEALNGGTNPAHYDSSTYPNYIGAAEFTSVANKLRSYPNNFLYSGYFDSIGAINRGIEGVGVYWSSTAFNINKPYTLTIDRNTGLFPGTGSAAKFEGISIRCVSGS